MNDFGSPYWFKDGHIFFRNKQRLKLCLSILGGNILLDDLENAKIADFGSAVKKTTALGNGDEPIGLSASRSGVSIYWSSPEIIKQEEFDQSTDIW